MVNNNAAALVLAATALAAGREIVVSRGEMIEIGDGFRLPELIASTGARLREVGTTNRTALADYQRRVRRGHRVRAQGAPVELQGRRVHRRGRRGRAGEPGGPAPGRHRLRPARPAPAAARRAGCRFGAAGGRRAGDRQRRQVARRAAGRPALGPGPLVGLLRAAPARPRAAGGQDDARGPGGDADRAPGPPVGRAGRRRAVAGPRDRQLASLLAAAGLAAQGYPTRPGRWRRRPGRPAARRRCHLPVGRRRGCGPASRAHRAVPGRRPDRGRPACSTFARCRRPGRVVGRGGAGRERPGPAMQVIATAGHADHGKSTLSAP